MTKLEQLQPELIFLSAGRKAFRMGVPVANNPYRDHPYRKLWEKGYRIEKKRFKDRKR